MTTLSTWRFATADGAESALRELEREQHRRQVTVDDVAVVAWPARARRPQTYQAGTADGTAALSGAFWGLLFALVLLLPLAEEGVDAELADLSGVGLPDAFLQQLRDRITPGTSALFLLSADTELDRLRVAVAGTEPVVLRLDRDQEAALRRAFDADDDLVTP